MFIPLLFIILMYESMFSSLKFQVPHISLWNLKNTNSEKFKMSILKNVISQIHLVILES